MQKKHATQQQRSSHTGFGNTAGDQQPDAAEQRCPCSRTRYAFWYWTICGNASGTGRKLAGICAACLVTAGSEYTSARTGTSAFA